LSEGNSLKQPVQLAFTAPNGEGIVISGHYGSFIKKRLPVAKLGLTTS
jgi:hypothetical protein